MYMIVCLMCFFPSGCSCCLDPAGGAGLAAEEGSSAGL